MTTAIVKASKELKNSTSNIRQHLDAVDRARDIYLGQIKRAEAEYYDRVKRVTAVLTGSDNEVEKAPEAQEEAAA
jgi:hypothetical protein